MAITFDCPGCSKTLRVPDELAGEEGKCPSCGAVVRIPAPDTYRVDQDATKPSGEGVSGNATSQAAICPNCDQAFSVPLTDGEALVQCPACTAALSVQNGLVSLQPQSVTAPAEPQWHLVTTDGQQFGPISESQIIQWIQDDRVKPGSKVWRKGMADWMPCDVMQPFMSYCRKPQRVGAPHADHGIHQPSSPVRTSGKAIASLVLGIVGLMLPFFGIIAGLLGLIFGAVAMKETASDPRLQGRGMAIAGLVMGVVGVSLWVICWVAIFAATSQPWPHL